MWFLTFLRAKNRAQTVTLLSQPYPIIYSMLIHAFDAIIVGPIGPNREIDTWKNSKVVILYQNLGRKDSFHASWSSGMTDKCPNMFHYVILSISKLWNSFGASGVLFPSYLGSKSRPKMPFLGKKVSFWTIFFQNFSSHMTLYCPNEVQSHLLW